MTRLIGLCTVVFLANAGLLVLQLLAGRLLAPFIGSSIQTWTSIIAAFLTGIASGSYVGGTLADRSPKSWKLALYLALGALTTLWMVQLPQLLVDTEIHRYLGLLARIPVLSFVMCLPVAFILSLIGPLAIRIGAPNIGQSGFISGLIFSVSTLGCLIGNYLTGFYLIPEYTINTIVDYVAALLGLTMIVTLFIHADSPEQSEKSVDSINATAEPLDSMNILTGFIIVFLCSLSGMTLELSATRLLANVVGVSIFSWTGVIGVMLAGTALGNFTGGILARKSIDLARQRLAITLMVATGLCGVVIIVFSIMTSTGQIQELIANKHVMWKVLIYTFSLFFLPMYFLGTISPQVIRLCIRGNSTAGQTAGRIYAVSSLGAIVGTFATGYLLISTLGVYRTILATLLCPLFATILVYIDSEWRQPSLSAFSVFTRAFKKITDQSVLLYAMSALLGIFVGGLFISIRHKNQIGDETNYYTIRSHEEKFIVPDTDGLASLVGYWAVDPDLQTLHVYKELYLDHLLHSKVFMNDPRYLHYRHEVIQEEFVRRYVERYPGNQQLLVIGGGGYTLPRYVRVTMPTCEVDVVEIDPGVTRYAYMELGLQPEWGIKSIHMDGRQFVAEKADRNNYHVVTLDAVNDFSVPWHLLTHECNEAVKKTLTKDGVYLVTVIDLPQTGAIWKSTYQTLKKSFKHVELLFDDDSWEKKGPHLLTNLGPTDDVGRTVLVLYASDEPLNIEELNKTVRAQTKAQSGTYRVPPETVNQLLDHQKRDVKLLTDQYAPVDTMMRRIYAKD